MQSDKKPRIENETVSNIPSLGDVGEKIYDNIKNYLEKFVHS